jgi:hypothetical protein
MAFVGAYAPEITRGEYAIECDRHDGKGFREWLPGIRGENFALYVMDSLYSAKPEWSFRIVCITPDVRNAGVYTDGWGY